jgi:hypothetical protein
MLSAQISITQRNVESAIPELPRFCRKRRISDAGAGTATDTSPPTGAASDIFGARGSWMRRLTTRLP